MWEEWNGINARNMTVIFIYLFIILFYKSHSNYTWIEHTRGDTLQKRTTNKYIKTNKQSSVALKHN